MRTEANSLLDYLEMEAEQRANVIAVHYADFEEYLEDCKEGLITRICNEKDFGRQSHDAEDLGVRVQTQFGTYSDVTGNAATTEVLVRSMIEHRELDEYLFEGVDDEWTVRHMVTGYYLMTREYNLFNTILMRKKRKDFKILYNVLAGYDSTEDLADRLQISPESARKKIYRQRKDFVKVIEPYFAGGGAAMTKSYSKSAPTNWQDSSEANRAVTLEKGGNINA